MFNLGLVSISFRKNSPEEILSAMKTAGLSLIEWGSDVHAPCDNPERLKEIAELQNKYGIKCCSYGTYFRMGKNKPQEIIPYIKAAKTLGADVLRIWCGCSASEKCKECGKHNLFDEAKWLSRIAQNEGVKLCLEFHPYTFSDCAESSLTLIKSVASPHFQMYWQPNQYRSTDENLKEAEKLSAFTENIHVFNWQGDNRFPLLAGADIWKEYLKCFNGNQNLLLEFMPDDEIETLPREACALRKIIGESV